MQQNNSNPELVDFLYQTDKNKDNFIVNFNYNSEKMVVQNEIRNTDTSSIYNEIKLNDQGDGGGTDQKMNLNSISY